MCNERAEIIRSKQKKGFVNKCGGSLVFNKKETIILRDTCFDQPIPQYYKHWDIYDCSGALHQTDGWCECVHVERRGWGSIHGWATSTATVTPLVMAGRMAHAKPHIQNRSWLWRSSLWHGWTGDVMLSKLQKLIALFCSFTPTSTLAGEIWMDQHLPLLFLTY